VSLVIREFRQRDDRKHFGAALELITAGLLDHLGARLEAPDLPDGETPDFLAVFADGRAYVECTTVTEIPDGHLESAPIRDRAVTALESVQNDDFYIAIREWEGRAKALPRLEEMAAELGSWLAEKRHVDAIGRIERSFSRDPDSVRMRLYSRRWERDGFRFTAFAIPKAAEARGSDKRIPYVEFDDEASAFEEVRSHIKLREDMSRKAAKYLNADEPLVLVATTHRWRLFDVDVRTALFGTVKLPVRHSTDGDDWAAGAAYHEADGLWTRGGIRFRNVAGVIVLNRAEPWSVGWGDATLYPNPWAVRRLPGAFRRLRTVSVSVDGAAEHMEGAHLYDALGLWQGWPEDPATLRALQLIR
jgi:hypothetical protein